MGRAIEVTFDTSARLRPDKNDGPEVPFDELLTARRRLKGVFLYAGDFSSSFSKEISEDC